MKRILAVFLFSAFGTNRVIKAINLFNSLTTSVFATNSLDRSNQEIQQDLQYFINRQVQQSTTDIINTIRNNTNSSSYTAEKIPTQVSPVIRSLNDSIKGDIASLQYDSLNNETIWILGGIYKIKNLTSETLSFNASFYIVKTNGSSFHSHNVYDSKLRLTADNLIGNNSIFINGTSAVTLRYDPVMNLPTSITLFGNSSISIWFEPAKF